MRIYNLCYVEYFPLNLHIQSLKNICKILFYFYNSFLTSMMHYVYKEFRIIRGNNVIECTSDDNYCKKMMIKWIQVTSDITPHKVALLIKLRMISL